MRVHTTNLRWPMLVVALMALAYLYTNFAALQQSYLSYHTQRGSSTSSGSVVNITNPLHDASDPDNRPTLLGHTGITHYMDDAGPADNLDPSFHDVHRVTKQNVNYPIDYYTESKDDRECRNLFSELYLEHLASHHEPYCEGASRGEFECFRTHRAEPFCVAKGVLINTTREEPLKHTAVHCQMRNFTAEREKATPEVAEAMRNLAQVESMPIGFFDTGVAAQMRSWNYVASDDVVDMGEGKTCDTTTSDGQVYLLVKRENHDNVWHKMLEVWQSQISIDAYMMAINPKTKKPYLTPEQAANIQVIFTESDAGDMSPADELWKMIGNGSPVQQRDQPPSCLGTVILPLYSSSSPFWAYTWEEADCHDTFLINAFLKRAYRFLSIDARKHKSEKDHISVTNVTIIDRKGRRKLRNQDAMVEDAKRRWPTVNFNVVDFAALTFREQIQLMRQTSVLVGLTGAGLTNIFWLPEESSLAEIQAPNVLYGGFRNLAKMRSLHYFTAHPVDRPKGSDADGWAWQTGEWVDMRNEVFQALVDAAINGQLAKGDMRGQVLPAGPYSSIALPTGGPSPTPTPSPENIVRRGEEMWA
jgi:protein O-GlcNAc transferase